jgi:hypothetical protein
MNSLQLPLKKKWFEMTKSGIKKEDYREIKRHWLAKLFSANGIDLYNEDIEEMLFELNNKEYTIEEFCRWTGLRVKRFDKNIMTSGYPKSTDLERILKLEHLGIEIREGNQEWGAEKGVKYFVIKHGAILA